LPWLASCTRMSTSFSSGCAPIRKWCRWSSGWWRRPAQGGSQAPPLEDAAGSSEVATLLQQLLVVQQQQNERMDTWARELKVVNQLHEFDQEYGTYKKVNNESGIQGRAKQGV